MRMGKYTLLKKFLLHKSSFLLIIFTGIQQIIVAFSTICIAKLSNAIVAKEGYWLWLILFITSLFIVYLPSGAAKYFLTASLYDSFKKYVDQFDKSFRGKAQYRSSNELKEKYQPYFNSEAWLVFSEALPFLSDWFSIILNVCFNILALGLAINPIFIGSYSVTLPLIVICLNCTQKIIENSSEIAQVSRAKMMQSLLSGWDSIFVGNRWNLNNWRKLFDDKHHKARETSLRSVLLVELTTSLSLILSLVPIIGSLVWLLVTQHHNYALLTALVATLPRQITTIQYMSDIVSYSAQWNSVKTRLEGVAKSLKLPENSEQFIGNISWGEIYAQNGTTVTPIFSLEDLEKITKGFGPDNV